MNVYLVYPEHCDYDEFDGIVVTAENKDRALEMISKGYIGESYFKEHQGEIYIKEIDLTKEQVILESFNAG